MDYFTLTFVLTHGHRIPFGRKSVEIAHTTNGLGKKKRKTRCPAFCKCEIIANFDSETGTVKKKNKISGPRTISICTCWSARFCLLCRKILRNRSGFKWDFSGSLNARRLARTRFMHYANDLCTRLFIVPTCLCVCVCVYDKKTLYVYYTVCCTSKVWIHLKKLYFTKMFTFRMSHLFSILTLSLSK